MNTQVRKYMENIQTYMFVYITIEVTCTNIVYVINALNIARIYNWIRFTFFMYFIVPNISPKHQAQCTMLQFHFMINFEQMANTVKPLI